MEGVVHISEERYKLVAKEAAARQQSPDKLAEVCYLQGIAHPGSTVARHLKRASCCGVCWHCWRR
jgi:hypothetical protein